MTCFGRVRPAKIVSVYDLFCVTPIRDVNFEIIFVVEIIKSSNKSLLKYIRESFVALPCVTAWMLCVLI
jgi:hypothetical protein